MQLIKNVHLAPKTGSAFVVVKGQVIRVIDTDGEQVSDMVCFAKDAITEYLSSSQSIDYNEKIYLSTGNTLYSNLSNPMLTIIRDKVGKHDFCLPLVARKCSKSHTILENPTQIVWTTWIYI